jgi:hypothetical protein
LHLGLPFVGVMRQVLHLNSTMSMPGVSVLTL